MIKALDVKTGMKFHDGSKITVVSETKCFVTVELSNGLMMEGKIVKKKWNKNSIIKTA
jgi:hypothetical protein